MEVVLNSDIARLVLGYLRDQNLGEVSTRYCKYSPHLSEEYEILKRGLIPVTIKKDSLIDIVREYCNINSQVRRAVEDFPPNVREAFLKQNLIGKITYLLKLARKNLNYVDVQHNDSKRRQSRRETNNMSSIDGEHDDDFGYPFSKKRRVSYCYVQDTQSVDSDSVTDDDFNSQDMPQVIDADGSKDIGTPCFSVKLNNKNIKATILDNPEFQNKLVENINKALETSSYDENSTNCVNAGNTEQPNSNEGQLLDDMIRNILDATEKDPIFDEVIEDVVLSNILSSATKTTKTISKAIQVSSPTKDIGTDILVPQQDEIQVVMEGHRTTATPKIKNSILMKPTSYISTPSTSFHNISAQNSTPSLIDPNFSISKLFLMNTNENNDPMLGGFQGLSPFNGEQVFIDLGTGQTYPFIVTNDVNCMMINRNDQEIIQQEQVPALVNLNGSQMIRKIDDVQPNKSSASFMNKLNTSSVLDKSHGLLPTSLDSKILKEKDTPEGNSIVNVAAVRSLSTPRRKSAHVRVLSFSPLPKLHESHESRNLTLGKDEHPIIQSVQILPQLQKSTIQGNLIHPTINRDDCSNSTSTDVTINEPLNTTVIPKINVFPADTPRRKTDIRSCKKILSNNEENPPMSVKKVAIKKPIKQIKKTPAKKRVRRRVKKEEPAVIAEPTELLDPLEQWRQMRLKTNSSNFDQHLREVSAKTPTVVRPRKNIRRPRRRIGGKPNKPPETSRSTIDDDDSPADSNVENTQPDKKQQNQLETIKKEKKIPKTGTKTYLNFKIKTPIKSDHNNDSDKINKDSVSKRTLSKMKRTPIKNIVESQTQNTDVPQIQIATNIDEEQQQIIINIQNTEDGNMDLDCLPIQDIIIPIPKVIEPLKNVDKELEKRTNNIAHLLDTPFKIDGLGIPVTPRFLLPDSINTPAPRSQFMSFSSLKHLDITTPSFAITPGSSLTPLNKETPKSGCASGLQTDYSSGGSYYRPDESEDLDKKLDRDLNTELRNRRMNTMKGKQHTVLAAHGNFPAAVKSTVVPPAKSTVVPPAKAEPKSKTPKSNTPKSTTPKSARPKSTTPKKSSSNVVTNKSPIIISATEVGRKTPQSAEMVVSTAAIEKVNSMTKKKPNAIPDFKISDALPELTDDSTATSSTSSSSSSTSSSSSSSSDSSSSSSCTQSSGKKSSKLLSDINSSEDEEWDIRSEIIKQSYRDNANANADEVLFPHRSFPPKKLVNNFTRTAIPPEKARSAANIQQSTRQQSDLQQKLFRVKNKLAADSKNKIIISKEKHLATKRIAGISRQHSNIPKPLSTPIKETNQMEVLTALHLSARKKPITDSNKPDDNAISDLISLKIDESSDAESLLIQNAALTLTAMSQKKQKITKQIEAQPLTTMNLRRRSTRNIIDIIPNANKIPVTKKGNKRTIPDKPPANVMAKKVKLMSPLSSNCMVAVPKKNLRDLAKQTKNAKKILVDKKEKSKVNKTEKNKDIKESSKLVPIPSTSKKIPNKESSALLVRNDPPVKKYEIQKIKEEDKYINNKTDNKKTKQIIFRHISFEKSTDGDSEVDDPYDLCSTVPSNELIVKKFEFFGDDNYEPEIPKNCLDLENATVCVSIDGIPIRLQCTNVINLFTMPPKIEKTEFEGNNNINDINTDNNKPIQSIPKKRERIVKLITNAPDCDKILPQNTSTPLPPKKSSLLIHKDFKNERTTSERQITNSQLPKGNPKLNPTCPTKTAIDKELCISAGSNTMSNTETTDDNLTKNIRTEDIAAILSHLHGK